MRMQRHSLSGMKAHAWGLFGRLDSVLESGIIHRRHTHITRTHSSHVTRSSQGVLLCDSSETDMETELLGRCWLGALLGRPITALVSGRNLGGRIGGGTKRQPRWGAAESGALLASIW